MMVRARFVVNYRRILANRHHAEAFYLEHIASPSPLC